jgi:hypothetical protein
MLGERPLSGAACRERSFTNFCIHGIEIPSNFIPYMDIDALDVANIFPVEPDKEALVSFL